MARNVENKCSIPDDHIGPRRSALFVATSLLGGYLDGRHQCLFDVIGERQRHQKYQRPFRRVMKLRGSWQNATERHRTPKQTVWKWRKRDSVQDHSHTASTVFRPPSHQRKRPWRLLCATFDGCRQMIDWRWCASFSIRLCLVRV